MCVYIKSSTFVPVHFSQRNRRRFLLSFARVLPCRKTKKNPPDPTKERAIKYREQSKN